MKKFETKQDLQNWLIMQRQRLEEIASAVAPFSKRVGMFTRPHCWISRDLLEKLKIKGPRIGVLHSALKVLTATATSTDGLSVQQQQVTDFVTLRS